LWTASLRRRPARKRVLPRLAMSVFIGLWPGQNLPMSQHFGYRFWFQGD
jgi:hypothetical protein